MCLFSSCPLLYSKIHRSSVVRVLPWGLTFISKFLGVGLNFHDFNESKQPCVHVTPARSYFRVKSVNGAAAVAKYGMNLR